jgi:hypothetical protein
VRVHIVVHSAAPSNSKFPFAFLPALTLAFALASLSLPLPLSASLGGDVSSVQADQAKLQASLQTTSKDRYDVHEMRAPNNVVVREFVSPAGKVFGVAWQGPTRPDLQQLLGPYFETFMQAAKSQKAHHVGHNPLLIQTPGLVVQLSGHTRAFFGKAYLPQQIPAGVRAEEIQ